MIQPQPTSLDDVAGGDRRPTPTEDEPRYRLAAAVRRISAVVVGSPLPDEEVAEAVEQLARIAEVLENSADPRRARTRTLPNLKAGPENVLPRSPIIGAANPIAPPVEVWMGEGDDGRPELRGRVTYDYPYEGPPNCVHGGVIAELFDELMGVALVMAERPAMTGTLTVRYLKPTPLLAPLDLVGRMVSSQGRKVFASAAIYHDGTLTAEADGVFIEGRRTAADTVAEADPDQ